MENAHKVGIEQPLPWADGRFSGPIVRNRYVIGDVHGCSRTLRKMVEEALELGPDDILYLLGDYIDRGPDSKGVLDYIMQLFSENYDLRPLRGNHEQLLLDALDDPSAFLIWKGNGGYKTLQEFGISHPRYLPQRYLDLFSAMPLMHLLDEYLLIHAGLDFSKDDPINQSSGNDLLWARDYRVVPAKLGDRTLVTGHSRTPLFAIKDSLATSHISLDNGCYSKGEIGYGALVALDLDTKQLVVVPNCD